MLKHPLLARLLGSLRHVIETTTILISNVTVSQVLVMTSKSVHTST